MARIRSIKPDFFKHERLFDAEQAEGMPLRIAFAGLWTVADREGRFRWRPRPLKLDVLPYDELDFADVLDALERHGFVVRYEVNGEDYGCIPSFHRHQHVNKHEAQSEIPAPPPDAHVDARACTIDARGERKGKERKDSSLRSESKTPPSATETTSPTQTPPRGGNGKAKPKSADKGTRLAEDWRPSEEAIAYCRNELGATSEILNHEYAAFMDWGLSATGPPSRKRDWNRAFVNWIRRTMNELHEREARERRWAEQRGRPH